MTDEAATAPINEAEISSRQMEKIYQHVVDTIHSCSQESGDRFLIALNLACGLLQQCAPHTDILKKEFRKMKKTLTPDIMNTFKLYLSITKDFEKARKKYLPAVGTKE